MDRPADKVGKSLQRPPHKFITLPLSLAPNMQQLPSHEIRQGDEPQWQVVQGKKGQIGGKNHGKLGPTLAHLNSGNATKKKALSSNKFYIPPIVTSVLPKESPCAKKNLAKAAAGVPETTKVKGAAKGTSFLSIMGYYDDVTSKKKRTTRKKKQSNKTGPETPSIRSKSVEKVSDLRQVTALAAPAKDRSQGEEHQESIHQHGLLGLPVDSISTEILPYLDAHDLVSLGSTCSRAQALCNEGHLWQALLCRNFPHSKVAPISSSQWKLSYQLNILGLVESSRCFLTKKTFLECELGVGLDFTINPKTGAVDYIRVSQDLLSFEAFTGHNIRTDTFGNKFQLFLPLYFTEEHFQRALHHVRAVIVKLCPDRKEKRFAPEMILDVFAKIINTFVVLLSDEGVSASEKSFYSFCRIHRLFLALAQEYPSVPKQALKHFADFCRREENRSKGNCPSLGLILPLLMVVDADDFQWARIRPTFLSETFDRSVLWICKKHPHLEKTQDSKTGKVESAKVAEDRVRLSREAMTVALRLVMLHVCFLKLYCRGSPLERARRYDRFFLGKEQVISFESFRNEVNNIIAVPSWKRFFRYVGLKGPSSQEEMAKLLRQHVKNSRRKKYHTPGMDFTRVQASGTSRILAKGQQYSTSSGLHRVVFTDNWSFEDGMKYLDATCIVCSGKKIVETVDYSHLWGQDGAIEHSGDVMSDTGGSHTIHINLAALEPAITSLVFVISAFASATLADIIDPKVSFSGDEEGDGRTEPLCEYNLDRHNKIASLKSVIMCKLYRKQAGSGWHVLAIGDSHKGDATDYEPIYKAVKKLL